jgi:hypothetical protein
VSVVTVTALIRQLLCAIHSPLSELVMHFQMNLLLLLFLLAVFGAVAPVVATTVLPDMPTVQPDSSKKTAVTLTMVSRAYAPV